MATKEAKGEKLDEWFAPAEYARVKTATGLIPYTTGLKTITRRIFQLTSGMTTYMGTSCAKNECAFTVNLDADQRVYLDRSFLRFQVLFADGAGGSLAPASAASSCCWNVLNCVSYADLSINRGQQLQRLDSNVGLATTMQYLCNMSREALTGNTSFNEDGDIYTSGLLGYATSQRFITPTIESDWDYAGGLGLSPESTARSKSFTSGPALGPIAMCPRVFQVPLADLFSTCSVPGLPIINQLDMHITIKNPTDPTLVFKTTASPAVPQFIVQNLQLDLCTATLSKETMDEEAKKITKGGPIERSAFLEYVPVSWAYAGSAFMGQSQKNIQGIIVATPAIGIPAYGVVNPLQFCKNFQTCLFKFGDGRGPYVDGLQFNSAARYLDQPQYTAYLDLVKRTAWANGLNINPAISCHEMIYPDSAGIEQAQYSIVCCVCTDYEEPILRDLAGKQVEIDGTGGTPTTSWVIYQRARYFKQLSNTQITVIE
jgi:hypothetical protein